MPSTMDPKEALLSGFQSQPTPRWTDADLSQLNRKRYNHGAVALKGSKILVVGGYEDNAAPLRSVEVYEQQKWNKKWPKLNQWRAEHATVLVGSRVYVLGGYNKDVGVLDSIEVLNLASKTPKWQLLNVTLPCKRRGCTAVAVGTIIHVLGGKTSNNDTLNSVDVFDTVTRKIFKGAPLTTGRYGAASAVVGRTIYIVGGEDTNGKSLDFIESLRLSDDKPKWELFSVKLSTPRKFSAVTVLSHCLVVIGGANDDVNELASVEVVDVKRNARWALSPLRQARSGCAAVSIKNSRIVVTGGNSSITGIFNSMEVLELHPLPIQTQIKVVERELKQARKATSIKNLFASTRREKMDRSKSSSLKSFLKELKQRANSHDEQESWMSSFDDEDEELPVYDSGRIAAKKKLKDSGQAQVYKGVMEGKNGTKETVAIKVFKRRSDWDDCKIELIALLRCPGHANVMDIKDFYEVPRPAFVMRFVAGGDLRDYLDKKGKMSGKPATDVLRGMGEGLAHLHNNGIIHRDLKSLNVLLEKKKGSKSFTPVLIDLGLGKAVDPNSATNEFETVGCLGTACWMAPEMASSGLWSTKTDMFALGIIMWEVLTGEYPYGGLGWNKVLRFVVQENGRPDTDGQMQKAKVSKSHQALVKSLWHKDPSRRPSAEEFVSRLTNKK